MGALAGAEMTMLDVGVEVAPGSAVAAAANYWRSRDPVPKRKAIKEEQFYEPPSTGSTQCRGRAGLMPDAKTKIERGRDAAPLQSLSMANADTA